MPTAAAELVRRESTEEYRRTSVVVVGAGAGAGASAGSAPHCSDTLSPLTTVPCMC